MLKAELEKYGHTSIDIKKAEASIEDCFMDLSNE